MYFLYIDSAKIVIVSGCIHMLLYCMRSIRKWNMPIINLMKMR